MPLKTEAKNRAEARLVRAQDRRSARQRREYEQDQERQATIVAAALALHDLAAIRKAGGEPTPAQWDDAIEAADALAGTDLVD